MSYMHSGMYGMVALQEGVRQMRGAETSVVHGVAGMFADAGTIVLSNFAE